MTKLTYKLRRTKTLPIDLGRMSDRAKHKALVERREEIAHIAQMDRRSLTPAEKRKARVKLAVLHDDVRRLHSDRHVDVSQTRRILERPPTSPARVNLLRGETLAAPFISSVGRRRPVRTGGRCPVQAN
jgi:hypothetical protein